MHATHTHIPFTMYTVHIAVANISALCTHAAAVPLAEHTLPVHTVGPKWSHSRNGSASVRDTAWMLGKGRMTPSALLGKG
jgi:hypothetical protein